MKELQADLKRKSDTIEKYYSDLQAQIDRLEVANTSRFERMEAINTSNEYKFNLIIKALETLLQRNTPFQGSSHGAMNSNRHQPFQVGNVKLDFARFDVVDHAALPDGQILKQNQPNMAACVAFENKDEEAVAMVEESPSVVDHATVPDGQILKGSQPDTDDCVASENKDKEAVAMVEESPSVVDHAALSDQQILNRKQPDMDDCLASKNKDGKAVAMVEESSSGDGAVNSNDSNLSMDYSAAVVASVRTLHISSPILADKSPFFCKLFSNGMRGPEQRCITLRIDASEEAALMELLKFMYSNTLSVNTQTGLLEVFMAANKFEVASCMIYCSQLLQNMAMTPESALLYLELPSSVSMADAVQPLTDAAKQYLVGLYKDITKPVFSFYLIPV